MAFPMKQGTPLPSMDGSRNYWERNTSNNIFKYHPVIEERQAAAEVGNPKFVAALTSYLHDFLQQHLED